MNRRTLVAALVLATLASLLPARLAAQDASVVFLVRHAEKATEPPTDPPLTPAGLARARALAELLADARLDAVWSTDYRRTRETAAPVADRAGLEVRLYEPGELEALAETLRMEGGRALVVGHSNTTWELVRLLGGDPGSTIDEAAEYDRLYVLVGAEGGPLTTLLRFGAPPRER
jgi:broad specificity phosphatase PhoE